MTAYETNGNNNNSTIQLIDSRYDDTKRYVVKLRDNLCWANIKSDQIDFEKARSNCPTGWRLPTLAEINNLANLYPNLAVNTRTELYWGGHSVFGGAGFWTSTVSGSNAYSATFNWCGTLCGERSVFNISTVSKLNTLSAHVCVKNE